MPGLPPRRRRRARTHAGRGPRRATAEPRPPVLTALDQELPLKRTPLVRRTLALVRRTLALVRQCQASTTVELLLVADRTRHDVRCELLHGHWPRTRHHAHIPQAGPDGLPVAPMVVEWPTSHHSGA